MINGLVLGLFVAAVVPIGAVIIVVMVIATRLRLVKLEEKVDLLSRRSVDIPGGAAGASAPFSPVHPAPAPVPRHTEPPLQSPAAPPQAAASVFRSNEPPPIYVDDKLPSRHEKPSDPGPVIPAGPSFHIDWEKFTAAQVFSWVGGVALFLGVGFFVKYAAEHGMFPPIVRVITGLLTGIGCVAGGLSLQKRKDVAVTMHTLCAAGVAILYADAFAARTLYGLVDPLSAFVFMILVTVLGFTLAVRLDSRYIALLGLVGGFLTPILVSTGRDNPVGLFGYAALLDLGLAAVVLRKRWDFLWGLAALGTLGLEIGWLDRFFLPEKILTAAVIQTAFPLLFLAVTFKSRQEDEKAPWIPGAGTALALLNMAAVFIFMTHAPLLARPAAIFTPLLLIDVAAAVLALRRPAFRAAHLAAGGVVFLALSLEMSSRAAADCSAWMYVFILLFAGLHAFFPTLLQRAKPSSAPWHAAYAVPAILFLPLVFPVVREAGSPTLFWLAVALMDLLVLAAAVLAGVAWLIVAALFLTLLLGLLTVAHAAPWGGEAGFLSAVILIAGGFSAAGLWLWRRWKPSSEADPKRDDLSAKILRRLPSLAALLPFLLLVTAAARPGWNGCEGLYGVGFLLAVLCVGLAVLRGAAETTAPALAGLALLQSIWWTAHGASALAPIQTSWLVGGWALFLLPPLLFKKSLADQKLSWYTAAASGPVYFWMLYHTVSPDLLGPSLIGALPAAMALIYGLAMVEAVQSLPAQAPHRDSALAAFGGVTLFFVSLIFPLQFDKEWITLGWAAEGAALLWLFHRIPHGGLKIWAGGLLALAFLRLAANPSVLDYHARTGTPVLNWYLYVYGTGALLFFLSSKLWRPVGERLKGTAVSSVLEGAGGIVLFLLMNIEIADFFSSGSSLTFEFSGSLGQDMAYTLGWGLFGLICLVLGLVKGFKGPRIAGTGLLAVTAFKLFLHDLWRLGQLYRVAAFVGLAAVLIVASFLYQRFLKEEKQ